jgi:hypothetical protein
MREVQALLFDAKFVCVLMAALEAALLAGTTAELTQLSRCRSAAGCRESQFR